MRPIWLLEANVDGLPAQRLEAEIKKQGMSCQFVKHFPGSSPPRDILGSESVPREACVLFMGTLPLMRHLRENRHWRPGGWCSFEQLSCSSYYAFFGEHLLNRHYALLPTAEAARLEERLFANYGRGGSVFIRPDEATKKFTGKVVDREEFEMFLAPRLFDPTSLVLVAEPHELLREWRLVIAHSNVIAWSQYCDRGQSVVSADCPAEVLEFAQQVLLDVAWRPDPLFVMEVCETAAGLSVLELNGFSCSSLYECDLEAIVRIASQTAALAW